MLGAWISHFTTKQHAVSVRPVWLHRCQKSALSDNFPRQCLGIFQMIDVFLVAFSVCTAPSSHMDLLPFHSLQALFTVAV